MLQALIKLAKMVRAPDAGRKPGMKASLMRHNGVTTLIITSIGKEDKRCTLRKKIWEPRLAEQ